MANVLTNIGKRIVTGRLLSTAPGAGTPGSAAPVHIGWGTGTAVAAATDTALGAEAAEARTAGTSSQYTTTTTNDTLQVTGTITAIAAKSISEAALFDLTKAQSGTVPAGNMFIRGDFTAVPLDTGDSIAFTFRWQIT